MSQEPLQEPELCRPPVDPPPRPARRSVPSLVLVNTGDGKGNMVRYTFTEF